MSEIVDLGADVDADDSHREFGGVGYSSRHSPSVVVASAGLIRAKQSHQDGPQHTDMHSVIIPTSGTGLHLVDFESIHVSPGTAIHIQPGQVQQFDMASTFDALVVDVRPEICPPDLFESSDPHANVDLGEANQIVASMARSLALEQARTNRSDGVMVAGASFILHHLARAGGAVAPSALSTHGQLLRMFRVEVEARFSKSRSVSVYARSIGTSTKTLARATTSLTGLAPKEIIDQRVVLEAKRLLGHSTESIAGIGEALGFSEATNFTKFFVRMTGQTPHEFRT